jgi:hypothetical protein
MSCVLDSFTDSYRLPSMLSRWLYGIVHHGMRAYYLPVLCGIVLVWSAFLPWMSMGDRSLGGVPSVAGIWVLGLGLLTVVLGTLSIITRRNSRHPLLLVGLAAFAILLLGEKYLERSVSDQIWARAQAQSIVGGTSPVEIPVPAMGLGAYVGLGASFLIALFGLTIVIRQVAKPYAEPEDDDV